MARTVRLTRLLFGTTLFCCSLAVSAQERLELEGIMVRTGKAPSKCIYNRLLPSPDMNNVVVWQSEARILNPLSMNKYSQFVVVGGFDEEVFWATSGPKYTVFSSLFRLEPLRWDRVGQKLYIRNNETRSHVFDPATAKSTPAAEIDPMWRHVRIRTTTHGNLDFLKNEHTTGLLKNILKSDPLRIGATVGNSVEMFTVRRETAFRVSAIDGSRERPTTKNAAFLRDIAMVRDGELRLFHMGEQREHLPFLPYSRWLFDLEDGRRVGQFGLTKLVLDRAGGSTSVDLSSHLSGLFFIADAVVTGDVAWALIDSPYETRLLRWKNDVVESARVCAKKNSYDEDLANKLAQVRERVGVLSRSEVVLRRGTESQPRMFGYLYQPEKRLAGDLVVYFHGGPSATMADTHVPEVVRELASLGLSILVLEYSGSVGGEYALSDRLPRFGLAAFRDDLAVLNGWIRKSGFGQVSIIGESFGGVPALVAAVKYPQLYKQIIFVAPLLRLRDLDKIVTHGFYRQPTGSSQLQWETSVFGGTQGRLKFSRDLADYSSRLRPSPGLSFYFGAADAVSSVQDMPTPFRGSNSVVTIPKVSHEMVSAQPLLWADIRAKLGIAEKAASPARAVGSSRTLGNSRTQN